MKVSESWLRSWVNPNKSATEIAHQLTMAGLEVESITPVAKPFSKVITAKVQSMKPHPDANKLNICQVLGEDDTLRQIICGAANVRAGLTVALATPGAKLPNGMKIKKANLRGEASEGMICSKSELGLEDSSDGIWELAPQTPIGIDLWEYLTLGDTVFDIGLTPNRADCLSIRGVAREVAALNDIPFIDKETSAIDVHKTTQSIHAKVCDEQLCRKYCLRVIKNINPQAASPLWLQEALRRHGVKSHHPVVDVTNYVMLELGQPMHAFDLSTLKQDTLVVRHAIHNEQITLLDNQTVKLSPSMLVISDGEETALAVAGIMGGSQSGVTESTRDIVLESALFDAINISHTARTLNLTTDSSQRFERGVDKHLQQRALERATELLIEIVGGECEQIISVESLEPDALPIEFNPEQVLKLTGVSISDDTMQNILNTLGCKVNVELDKWFITPPSHRVDLNIEVDIVEEILRIYGYDALQSVQTKALTPSVLSHHLFDVNKKIAEFLCHQGFNETINYSFVDPEIQNGLFPEIEALNLINPISQELSQMRVSLLPGLMAALIYNVHRQQKALKIFEQGTSFVVKNNHCHEQPKVAGLLYGMTGELNWSEEAHDYDFYDLKGVIESLLRALNVSSFEMKAHHELPALHPGQSAIILDDKQNEMGIMGALHPEILTQLGLSKNVFLFELNLDCVQTLVIPKYKPISKFPSIRRDLSFLIDKGHCAFDVKKSIVSCIDASWLKSFDIFDVYHGSHVPYDKKSMAIALTLQHDSRTLIDSEINDLIDAIIKKLQGDFSIILRD